MSDRSYIRVLDENARDKYRQELISSIENELSEKLDEEVGVTTYISDGGAPLVPDDTKGFEDMLREVDEGETTFLIIDSPGGDAETALRVIRLYREAADSYKTIVPNMAKSAATQICLGSNEIYMGRNSELGPIDPLIPFRNTRVRAQTILNSVQNLSSWQDEWEIPPTALDAIARNFDPSIIQQAQDSKEYIESKASEISKEMVDNEEEADDIVEELMKTHTHGKSINIGDADEIGLCVEDLRDEQELWDDIWEYYLRSSAFIREEVGQPGKLLDTKNESLLFISS